MEISANPEIKAIIERLKSSMVNYMPHASYTQSDVEICLQIMLNFLEEMDQSASKEAGIKIVEKTVMSLNELNEKLNHELIETDQREDIAEIIIFAGHLKGYNGRDEDITEEWREW